jgi:hypothetical protein
MTLQTLYVHWKAVRLGLVPATLAAFGLPLLVAQGLPHAELVRSTTPTSDALAGTVYWTAFFPVLAALLGALLALSAWNWDHRGSHVYALSLPISRGRYALLKFSAGALLALLPLAGILMGSVLAIVASDVPDGLHAYPLPLAGRFLTSTLVAYAVVFALAAGTIRTTVIVLSVLIAVPTILSMGQLRPYLGDASVSFWITQALRFGPFRIFYGNWALFDV